jgi:hypothetical protein
MSEAVFAALVWLCLEDGRALLKHGFVEEEAEPFSQAGSAVGSEKLQNSVEKVRVIRVGHVWVFLVGCVWLHPNTRPH